MDNPTMTAELEFATLSPTLTALHARVIADRDVDEQDWIQKRKSGVTATDAVRLRSGSGAVFRSLRREKAAETIESWRSQQTEYGRMREGTIAEWVARKFGIYPTAALFAHPDYPRDLATPDGVGVNYDDQLRNAEIKTSVYDLTPGDVDSERVLQMRKVGAVARQGYFWSKTDYYVQMQWQMWVTGADRCLFVWEQHDGVYPLPQPLHFEPAWCWVLRDEEVIAELVAIAHAFQAEQDDFGDGDAIDVAEYNDLLNQWRAADDEVKEATARRDAIRSAVIARVPESAHNNSFIVSNEAATLQYVEERAKTVVDTEAWERKAPVAFRKYQEAANRYSKEVPGKSYFRMSATRPAKKAPAGE